MSMGSDHALVMSVTDGNSLRLLTFVIMFYALLVLAILLAIKLFHNEARSGRAVRCQYCENGSPQLHQGFGGFVHLIDGTEYECERPTMTHSDELEETHLRPSPIPWIAAHLLHRPSHP
jgi:hypothetical protein